MLRLRESIKQHWGPPDSPFHPGGPRKTPNKHRNPPPEVPKLLDFNREKRTQTDHGGGGPPGGSSWRHSEFLQNRTPGMKLGPTNRCQRVRHEKWCRTHPKSTLWSNFIKVPRIKAAVSPNVSPDLSVKAKKNVAWAETASTRLENHQTRWEGGSPKG